MADDRFHVFDTTLRDGAQQEGINLTVADKLAIARHLDEFGVGFIEGGWPGANPRDTEFFRRAQTEIDFKHAQLAAFGATRRAGVKAADDPQVAALRESGAPVVTLVAKTHDRHVELALRTTLEENLAMVRDTVSHLRAEGQRVFLDAEHFFDGYRANPAYALEVVRTAAEAGADVVVLCDTNGGMLPDELADVVATVRRAPAPRLGIHCQDDTGCAVANTLAAVDAGATHVQCTANGYGERVGNANLFPVVGQPGAQARATTCVPDGRARRDDPHLARDRRGRQPHPQHPPALRRASRPSRTRPGLHASRHQGRPRPLPAHRPRAGRQRHADAGLRHGRPRLDRAQGPGARLRPVGGDHAQVAGRAGSRSWSPRATPSRPPTPPSSCCCATRSTGERRRYFEVESWRAIVEHRPDGGERQRGHGQAVRQGRAHRRHRRGQRPGQRPGPGAAAGAGAALPAAGQAGAGRLQGPHPGGHPRHRRRHPRAHHLQRRRRPSGPRSASPRTSSPPPGRRWRRPSPTACCARATSRLAVTG